MKIDRDEVFGKFSGKCAYCGCKLTLEKGCTNTMEPDHIEPKVRGGSDDIENLRPSCIPCNKYKSYGDTEEFRNMLNQLFTTPEYLFKSKNKMQVAVNFGLIQLGNWDGRFYFEKEGV